MARKLWLASRILGSHAAGGPFGKPLPDHTMPEIDFILEMGAADEPDRYTFLRGGKSAKQAETETRAAWHNVATGKALEQRMEADGLAEAQRRLNAYKAKLGGLSGGLKPGFSKGGKPVNDA